jgi:hypothetical protein
MMGIVYLLAAILVGMEIAMPLLGRPGKESTGNRIWLLMASSFGVGVLVLTWLLYLTAYVFHVWVGSPDPMLYGNILVLGAALILLGHLYGHRKRKGRILWETGTLITDRKLFRKEAVFYGILLVFLTWIMFYVFHIRDQILYSGYTVFSDYAPHTAMIRSFSKGTNFPTQYPHFGGEDVKYHFMFQFLVGNLEYLGLPLDWAYNLPSVLSLLGFLIVLCQLAHRLSKRFAATVLTVLFFFFRSGTAFFRYVWEHIQAGDLWQTLSENTTFIGYTTNENWGLWNFNVYLNQRHFGFGLLLAGISVWVFLDWLEAGAAHEEKGFHWVKDRFLTKEAWICRHPGRALLVGMILGLNSFWNGAVTIGALLILLGFAVFSDGKLDYALAALAAVILSLLQTKIFIQGSAMSPAFQWGFLAENKSIPGVLWYLVQISGIAVVGLVVAVFFMKRQERMVLLGFLFPLIFAFVASLTPDITVNHKYIMISWAFLAVFWGWIIVRLTEAIRPGILVAVVLSICLTATGIYDFVIIIRNNAPGHRTAVDLESDVLLWLEENLTSDDLILTPEYSMSDVTLSGVMMYCGWPYYAWSAGYDTYYRADQAKIIYSTDSQEELEEVVQQENITYILFEEDMTFEDMECQEELIARTYPLVYQSEDGRRRIYETR